MCRVFLFHGPLSSFSRSFGLRSLCFAQFLMVDTQTIALRPFCFCNLGFGADDCYPTEGHILRPLGSLLLLDPEEPSCLLLDGEAATFSRLGTAVPQLSSGEPASVRGGASSSCCWYLKQFPYSLPSVPCPPLQFRFVATSIPTLSVIFSHLYVFLLFRILMQASLVFYHLVSCCPYT